MEQVQGFGANVSTQAVTNVTPGADGFTFTTEDGQSHHSDYLIIAEGKGLQIAESLGLAQTDEGVKVDHNYRTAVANLYAIGRSVRKTRSQAVISAGTGATAALDILATEQGKDFVDYDSVD
jgi:thioredoxin reductase